MLGQISVCFVIIPEGMKLLDLFIHRIKRFIEKLEEYRCIQLVNVSVNDYKYLTT